LKVNRFNLLRWISLLLISAAVILTVVQLIRFSRMRAGFAPGTYIAGIPVGGLDQQQAADRITTAYNLPIELGYEGDYMQVKPSNLGFELDLTAMIAAADQKRVTLPFWSSFWNYLWNQPFDANVTPLQASIDENRIRTYLLEEIASRYDEVPSVSIPVPGTVNFQMGESGKLLDIERSIPVVEQALRSANTRSAQLLINEIAAKRPAIENLQDLIEDVIDRSGFDGLTEVYIMDLQKREEINFAYEIGINYDPEIAFTAASTVKIPIMVSVFSQLPEPTPLAASDLIELMVEESKNPPADNLMQQYLDINLGPILVTEDMQALGLSNTFLAGYFFNGAPLLRRYTTPANQRFDYNTEPDPYNQTTTVDMGMLLDDLYQCAQTGGGSFAAVFGDQVSQSECQLMITFLSQNKNANYISAGLPDGTNFAHKHGYTAFGGVTKSTMDAGIVFTQDGDYVIVIAMYQPTQLIFNVSNLLFAQISTAVYNYFDIS